MEIDNEITLEQELKMLSDKYQGLKDAYVKYKEAAPDAVRNRYRVAKLMEKLSIADEYIIELEVKVKAKNVENELLREQLREKRDTQLLSEDAVMVSLDGKGLGAYVPQVKYMKKIDEIKQLKSNMEQLIQLYEHNKKD